MSLRDPARALLAVLVLATAPASCPDPALWPRPATPTSTRPAWSGALEVWVDAPGGPRRLGASERLGAGDRVQLAYRDAPSGLLTLAGVDETGVVEVYGTWAADTTRGWHPAPVALELDGALGVQWLYGYYTDRAPTPDQVERVVLEGDAALRAVPVLKER